MRWYWDAFHPWNKSKLHTRCTLSYEDNTRQFFLLFSFFFFLQSLLWINKGLPMEAQAGEAASVSRWSVRLKTISQSVGEMLGCCVTELDSSARFLNRKWAWDFYKQAPPLPLTPLWKKPHETNYHLDKVGDPHPFFPLTRGRVKFPLPDYAALKTAVTAVCRCQVWALLLLSVNRSRLDVSRAALSALDTGLFESQWWPSEGTAWFRSH